MPGINLGIKKRDVSEIPEFSKELVCDTPTDCCLVFEIATMDGDRRKYFGRIALFDREKNVLFRFVHKMVGAWSSARPPGKINLGKLWKVFFIPGFCATYVDL